MRDPETTEEGQWRVGSGPRLRAKRVYGFPRRAVSQQKTPYRRHSCEGRNPLRRATPVRGLASPSLRALPAQDREASALANDGSLVGL